MITIETRNERKIRNKARLDSLEANHATKEAQDAFRHKAYSAQEHIPLPILEVIRKGIEPFKVVKLDVVEITVEDRKTKKKYSWKR